MTSIADMRLRSTLADGVALEDLFDVSTREVSMRVLSDPEVYSLELDRLWNKAWLIVAHETELPSAGDFVTRDLGADPVIVSRSRSGAVNVLLNVCRHRGMEVCRTEVGKAKQFRCSYHGWVYDGEGAFVGAPVKHENMHGDVLGKKELGLRRAKVELYGGFVWATWDLDAAPLDDFLGDIKWYVDTMWNRTEGGLELLGPPQRYVINGNWKCAGEQFAGDGYHTLTLHRSLFELGVIGGDGDSLMESAPGMYGVDVSCEQGHGLRCIPLETTMSMLMGRSTEGMDTMTKLRTLPPGGLTPEMVEDLPNRMTPAQLEVLATAPPQVGGFFPNAGNIFIVQPIVGPDGQMKLGASSSVHTFTPKGPGQFEFVNYLLVEKDAPQEIKDEMLRVSVRSVGSSGTVEQDDAECWPSMTRAAQGGMGRQQTLKYQALLGEHKPADWPGPGLVYEGFSKDDNQWNWWLRYRDYLLGKA